VSTDPVRLGLAAVAVLLWLLLTVVIVAAEIRRRGAAARRTAEMTREAAGSTLVVYASQTGFAEELAGMTARALSDAGQTARLISVADLDLPLLKASRRVFFVVSTTGEGDAPDSASRMVRTLLGAPATLNDLSYALLSLGDRSYKDYCGFGRAVDHWLRQSGALPLFDAVEVDDADPDAIRHWQHQLNQITGGASAPDWTPAAYQRWRLADRRLLNPGSPGGETWHVVLTPLDGGLDWSAGDIAEIGVPAPDGSEVSREYSIASLPSDGGLELVVRLMTTPDGAPGLGSGRLTQTLAIGDELPLRVRRNSGFHGPDAATPLILIGAGTGIAGLRGHLRARRANDGGSWLMFGERTSAHDSYFDDELQAALVAGALTRLDRIFSRDAEFRSLGDGAYVQALIDRHAEDVRAWVERGAAVYVCGSLEGMAPGVHAALERALGVDGLIALSDAGRYRRDVY
jgi:sulfite reductase (NADPH) flavoprotein alpha-component